MDTPESVLRFLVSEGFEKRPDRPEPGSRPFITISRQAGAGGRSVAEALLKRFDSARSQDLYGWQWMDKSICDSLARDPRLGVSMKSLLDERFRGRLEDYLTSAITGTAPQIKVYRALFSTMRSLAAVGRVILVGRGGACATRGYPGGVHIRLVGSRPARIERAALRLGMTHSAAERWVDEQDKARSALMKEYFRVSSDDPLLYDATYNTDHLPPEHVAESVAALVLLRARMPAHA